MTGQTCIAGSRLLVQRSMHDRFVKRLVEVAGAAKIRDRFGAAFSDLKIPFPRKRRRATKELAC